MSGSRSFPIRWILLLAVLAGAALISQPATTHGAPPAAVTLVVNTVSDDADPADGQCSLREAIPAANADTTVNDCTIPVNGVSDRIEFDIGGATPLIDVLSELPIISEGVYMAGNTHGATRVELRGRDASFIGLRIQGADSTIDHMVINSFSTGVRLEASTNTLLVGNFIGMDADGNNAAPNSAAGIAVGASTMDATIGDRDGWTPGAKCTHDCNLISGNSGAGITIEGSAERTLIKGNMLGTDVAGTSAMPNHLGIYDSGVNTLIGGIGEGNLISGNDPCNIQSQHGSVTIQGNFIGSDTTGTNRLSIADCGMHLLFTSNALIGGTSDGEGNLIADGQGIWIFLGTHPQVLGNLIGTAIDGTSPLGNDAGFAIGVYLDATNDSQIGGPVSGEENTIAFRTTGVQISTSNGSSDNNSIQGNSIHSDTGKGILLSGGANTGILPPVITSATAAGANGTACANCIIDVYSDDDDEGAVYEGATTAAANGAWTYTSALAGPNVTATATDADGNTSEFSAPFVLPLPATPTPSPTGAPTPTGSATPMPTPSASPTPTPFGQTASPTPTPGAAIQGDADCNGTVELKDVPVLLADAIDAPDGEPCASAAAGDAPTTRDVNCDGKITGLDALDVLRDFAGLAQLPNSIVCPAVGDLINP